MPRIADYSVIRDSSFEIRTGGDIDRSFDFSLYEGFHRGSRSILAYVVDPEANVSGLKLRISVNGTSVKEATFSSNSYQTLHEVLSANLLRVGSNTIDFRIISGSGNINVSDIVLWWQRDI